MLLLSNLTSTRRNQQGVMIMYLVKKAILLTFIFLVTLSISVISDEIGKNSFPTATPESQGLSSEALNKLCDVIKGYVDDDQIVGAEMVIIKNRKTVLDKAFGWKDREDKVLMTPNTIFSIRSMTKPITGTAIQMLIEEGKLALSDPVSKYLPAFDNDKSRKITIEQLLTHRSGLPASLLTVKFKDGDTLQSVAKQAGERGPDFEPGTKFQFSDTGTDTLGAVVEKISGMSLDKFIKQRILEPLDMTDTITLVKDDPRSSRICSTYVGKKNAWLRQWKPGDKPIYPFTMGSQSLYCTPTDYAKFLALWMDNGKIGDKRIISQETIKQSLTPVSVMPNASSFPNLNVYYGRMWMIYAKDMSKPLVFGHDGSGVTFSWVLPDRDLIILFFTQSRGTSLEIYLEEDIDHFLINPTVEKPNSTDMKEDYKPYFGKYITDYQSGKNNEYTILEQDGQLAVQLPQGKVVKLMPPDAEGKRRLSISQGVELSFERDSDGNVTNMLIHQQVLMKKETVSKSELKDIPEKYKPYAGKYLISAPGLGKLYFIVLMQNSHLAVKYPEGSIHELKEPNQNGKWRRYDMEQEGFTFNQDSTGKVIAMTMHQVIVIKKGVLPPEPPLDLEKVNKYLGIYRDEKTGQDVEIIINNNHLSAKVPTVSVPLELYPPDESGLWVMRQNPSTSIRFNEKNGKVISYTVYSPNGEAVRIKVDNSDPKKNDSK